jgi:hypothetical protein
MKNTILKAQLEALHDIGLDRVNAAVAAVKDYVEQLETNLENQQHIGVTIAELQGENMLLRAELAAVQNALTNPTPKDAAPSPTPGFAGDPPGGSPGAV